MSVHLQGRLQHRPLHMRIVIIKLGYQSRQFNKNGFCHAQPVKDIRYRNRG